jgi:pimeloyl-ACP methyl ester carboxylesterase
MVAFVLTCPLAAADDSMPPEGYIAAINDMEMYYEIHGKGDPLILVHGFTVSGQVWKPFISELGKHYQLIVPDLRGHGRSTNPSDKFTHRQSAIDMFALLDTLEVREIRAIGVSSGGMTLLHMATGQPERVEAMVLVGATHYFPKEAREIQESASFDQLSEEQLESLRKVHKHGDAQIRAIFRQFHDFKDSYDDMNFTLPYLSTIKARTLILHGDRDAHFPVMIPVDMYRSIPRAYLWIVPNGGHVPIADDPPSYTGPFLEFLNGEWEDNNSPR